MGGALAAAAAVLVDDISAAVPFYGTPPAALADVTKTKAPVQGHFGETDMFKGFADVDVSVFYALTSAAVYACVHFCAHVCATAGKTM